MTIRLTDIELFAYHGVFPQERVDGGRYGVEVELEITDKAAETDDLNDTVNYAEVYQIVTEEMAIPANLIEHVAWRIAKRIRNTYEVVSQVRVKVTKKKPPIQAANINASVEICV